MHLSTPSNTPSAKIFANMVFSPSHSATSFDGGLNCRRLLNNLPEALLLPDGLTSSSAPCAFGVFHQLESLFHTASVMNFIPPR